MNNVSGANYSGAGYSVSGNKLLPDIQYPEIFHPTQPYFQYEKKIDVANAGHVSFFSTKHYFELSKMRLEVHHGTQV